MRQLSYFTIVILLISCGKRNSVGYTNDDFTGYWANVCESKYYVEWNFAVDSVAIQLADRSVHMKKYYIIDDSLIVENNIFRCLAWKMRFCLGKMKNKIY